MSDAGKVSLPTPERIKRIKEVFGQVGSLTGLMANELFAALEETQQQVFLATQTIKVQEDTISFLDRTLENLRAERDGLKEHRSDLVISNTELQGKLLHAQQTIARKQLYIEKLELSRESAQKATDNISKEKGLELFEARQTIAWLTAALIAERDAALVWDGIGTIRRINEALGEGYEADAT